ncbi:hypothetical protein GL4_0632 [Methyloceanibacter caenitepidi]|uniref:Uncharacterized protein n=2 Tax=Methyloceanibacter caenitepidi TaxID=1384459 RepID=A0A0A8JZU4_9HYPH|nr:hypothetical protein GL4_0632 [Methyloceanibacter caenitepidi]
MLGEVRGELKGLGEKFDGHEKRTCRNLNTMQRRLSSLDKHLGRVVAVEAKLEEIAPIVNSVQQARWKAAGFVAGVSLVAGGVGGAATLFLNWFA